MADGASLTLALDHATAERLADAARLAGMTPEAYALERLSADLAVARHDWTEADRRLAEYDRTGEFITLEEAMSEFRSDVEAGRTPTMGQARHELMIPFGKAGYVVQYRRDIDTVTVVRIFHMREDR